MLGRENAVKFYRTSAVEYLLDAKPMKSLFTFVILILTIGAAHAADSPTLGDKVVAFCKEHMEKTVGNGECAALAAQALKAAEAKTRAGPDRPNKGDYVWGKQVYMVEATPDGPKETGKFNDIRSGDIMQFRDVKFGASGGFHHHTAVVAEVDYNAGKIKTYQQNIGGKRFVMEGHPNLKHLAEGWIRFYRPVLEKK